MSNRSGRTFYLETICSLPGKFVNSMYEKTKLICREFEVFD